MTERFFPISGKVRDVPDAAPEPVSPYTLGESFVGGFNRQSTVAAAFEAYENDLDWAYDENYLVFDDPDNDGYDPSHLIDARSAEHAAYLRGQIDKDREDLDKAQSSWAGVMGEFIGALGPEAFVGGALLRGTQMGYKGFAATEAGLVAASEALLHTQQTNRTIQESLLNTGITYGASVVLGKAGVVFNRLPPPEPDVPLGVNVSTVGAMEVPRELSAQDLQMTGGKIAETLSIGPLARILSNQISPDASEAALKIADSAFAIRGGQEGKTVGTTVESATKRWAGQMESALDETMPLVKESGLAREDFWTEVGNAMTRADVHQNPQVQQTAERLRGVVQSLEDELKQYDLLPRTRSEMVQVMSDEAGRDVSADIAAYEARLAEYEEALGPEPSLAIDGVRPEMVDAWRHASPGYIKTAEDDIFAKANDVKAAKQAMKRYREEVKAYQARMDDLERPVLRLEDVSPKNLSRYRAAPETLPKYADSYFPRSYRLDQVLNQWEALKSQLTDSFLRAGVPSEEAPQAALDALQNITAGGMAGRALIGRGKPNPLKQRMIQLTDDVLSPYVERRADIVLRNHVRSVAPYLEMTKRFDDVNLEDQLKTIDDQYVNAIDAAETLKEKTRLQKRREQTIEDLGLLRDRALHRIDGAADRTAAGKAVRFISTWNAAAQLGGIVLTSSPDVARPLMAYGLRAFAGGAGKTIGHLFRSKAFRNANRQQLMKFGVGIERALNQRALDLMDTNLAPGESATRWLGAKWAKWSGFNHYTDFMEHLTAQIASDWLMRQARIVGNGGQLKRSAIERVTRMGLDENALRAINTEMVAGAPQGALWMPNTARWQDQNVARIFDEAMSGEVHRSIIRIGIGDKPAFMDQAAYQLLFQYWSFGMASTNRMLVAGIQQRDAQLLTGIIASVGLGMIVRGIKAELRGDDTDEWTGEKWILEGIDGSGLVGIWSGPLRMLQYPLGQESSRYIDREMEGLAPIGGPTASTVGGIMRTARAAAEGDWEDAKKQGARVLPFVNNTWHVRQALERMGGAE